jgi:Tfp pilus assembly protein PilN
MNFFSKHIMSVDIRDGSFSVTAVKKHLRRSTIIDARTYPLKASPASERAKREGVISGLDDFLEKNGARWDEIIVVLSRKSVLFNRAWFPSTVKENVGAAIDFEVENLSPFKREESLYDYKVVEESPDGSKICVLLNFIRRDSYEDIIHIFRECSLKPTALVASPVVWEGVDWLFSVNPSSEIFLVLREGQDFVLNTYSSRRLRDSVLCEGPARVTEEILKQSGEENEVSPVFIWGDGLEEYERSLTEHGAKTFEIVPSQFSEHFISNDADVYDAEFIPALCAGEVVEQAQDALNLIPVKDRPRKGKLLYHAFWVLTVLVLLSLFLVAAIPFLKQAATIAHLERELNSLSVNVDEIQRSKEEIETLASRLNEIQEIRDRNPLDVVRELTLRLPSHTWLSYFHQKGEKIEIRGISESASSLISILESSPLFKDVAFTSPVVKNREGTETFRLSMYLE